MLPKRYFDAIAVFSSGCTNWLAMELRILAVIVAAQWRQTGISSSSQSVASYLFLVDLHCGHCRALLLSFGTVGDGRLDPAAGGLFTAKLAKQPASVPIDRMLVPRVEYDRFFLCQPRPQAGSGSALACSESAGIPAPPWLADIVEVKFSRQNNLTNFFVVQASRLLENAGGTPAPQGANQSTYCDAAPREVTIPNTALFVNSYTYLR